MYTRRQYLNSQAIAFVMGILFTLSIVICAATIFVLYFALFSVDFDVLGNAYLNNPNIVAVIARVQKIAEGFTK